MDLWGLARSPLLGMPVPDYRPVGRLVARMAGGVSQGHELAVGWVAHYVTGIVFAAVLLAIAGPAWSEQPTLWLAMLFGVATVAVPFLVVQPAMGAGFAGSRTPRPWATRAQSLLTHA